MREAFVNGRNAEYELLARQAFALDSMYPPSRISLANALWLVGQSAKADTLLRRTAALPGVSPGDAFTLSVLRAFFDGDLTGVYRILVSDPR